MATLTLEWGGGLEFSSAGDGPAIQMASRRPAVPSPMQTLAYAVMGCMGMDVVYALEKGHHRVAGLTISFDGTRAPQAPRHYTAMAIHFDFVTTARPADIERAIEESRTRYCSAWHSIRPDVALTTTWARRPVEASE